MYPSIGMNVSMLALRRSLLIVIQPKGVMLPMGGGLWY